MGCARSLRAGKTLRVNLRVDAASKRALERAAAYTGSTLSDFVLSNALAAASELIRTRESVTLAPRDWDAFFEALMDPPEPGERLREALRRHDELYG